MSTIEQCDIGIIGLAVMGQNLALNINDHDFKVIAFNRSANKTQDFINTTARNTNITAAYSIKDMVNQLKKPRRIMLMVKAGDATDELIRTIIPLLTAGDIIIIDGGNANFIDTESRIHTLKDKGIYNIGTGISGGEEGARFGLPMMSGGMIEAWQYVKPIFQAIAAKTPDNVPCCQWIGQGGAGHFVKMVHNGFEYGDMQLICEAYQFMKDLLKMDNKVLANMFEKWNLR